MLFNEHFRVTLPLPFRFMHWIFENSPYLVFHDDFSLFFNDYFSMTLPLPTDSWAVKVKSSFFLTLSAHKSGATVMSHWNFHWKAKENHHEMLVIFKPWAPMNRGATVTSQLNFHWKRTKITMKSWLFSNLGRPRIGGER